MFQREQMKEGMTVRSADGHKLGKIENFEGSSFIIEKGFFSKHAIRADYSEVSDIRNDEVILALTRDEISRLGEPGYEAGAGATTGYGAPAAAATSSGQEELRVPVVEEELDVVKRDQEAGRVRITKEVETEQKRITVPVTRERIRVERVPVDERTGRAIARDENFERESYEIPLREEKVEVRKRPVVREEVRVAKDASERMEEVDETIRKERVNVDESGEARTGYMAPDETKGPKRY